MKVDILGTKIDNITRKEAQELFIEFSKGNETKTIYTPNAEICMEAYKNSDFRDILNNGSLVIPDGQGVVLASKILKPPVKEKVAGFKLILSIFEKNENISFFLFGSKPGVTKRAKKVINEKYNNITINGHRNGYFKEENINNIIEEINNSNSQVLLVGLGAPKQEYFIDKYKDKINCNLIMGVGGSIDVLAGEVKRVPEIFVKLSLEWFYRLLHQPKRLKRMLKIPVFLMVCIKREFLKNK